MTISVGWIAQQECSTAGVQHSRSAAQQECSTAIHNNIVYHYKKNIYGIYIAVFLLFQICV